MLNEITRKGVEYWHEPTFNNVWTKSKFNKEEAENAMKSLRNCRNTTDCVRCVNTFNSIDCVDCVSCNYCISCVNCNNCDSCYKCKSVVNGLQASFCKNASGITKALSLDGEYDTIKSDCEICEDCSSFLEGCKVRGDYDGGSEEAN